MAANRCAGRRGTCSSLTKRATGFALVAAAVLALALGGAASAVRAEGWLTGALGSAANREACMARLERMFVILQTDLSAAEISIFGDSVALYDLGDEYTDAVGRCWPSDGRYDALLFVHDTDNSGYRDAVFDTAQEVWDRLAE